MKYLPVLLLLCFTGVIASKRTQITRYERRVQVVDDEFSWVTPHEIMEHLHTLSRVTGAASPRKLPGYSPALARKFHRHLTKKGPKLIDHIVNLGHHFADADIHRKLSGKEFIPDVARRLRGAHKRRLETVPEVFRFLEVTSIGTCPADPGCAHAPCIKEYLNTPYDPFDPAYGGSGGYEAATASIKGTDFWSGDEADRTNGDDYSANLIALQAAKIAKELSDAACDAVDDDIEVCILCVIFELPNPGKIVCEVFDGLLGIAELVFDSLKEQMDFQDGLVQGAEIEASYEHTRNLLHKQCAIYDEALCRCSLSLGGDESDRARAYGLGCDGKDSNCNDEIDECDEDIIPPTIDLTLALKRCGGYFATLVEARKCVLESVVATDDCQAVEVSVEAEGVCEMAVVVVTAKEKYCNKTTTASVPVFVDGKPPVVSCSFGDSLIKTIETTGPRLPRDVGFTYEASDNCGKAMNVTVDVYSSEIEDFNAQEMALFFQNNNNNDTAELYLAANYCTTVSNGQCIKDPAAQDARLYTAIVSATDVAGNYNKKECQVKVVPKGKAPNNDVSTEDSTQRFRLTSYTSLWSFN